MKKKMSVKSIVSCLLCIVLVAMLTACGSQTEETPAEPEAPAEEQGEASTEDEKAEEGSSTEGLVFGFANYTLTNPYCATMAEGAISRAEELGIEINVVDNQVDATNQVSSIENFITMGVDGILILPVENTTLESVVQEAVDAGIPVISNSQEVSTAKMFVAADDHEMGYNSGKAAADWLNENNGGAGKVAYLNMPAIPSIIDRENGFKEALEEYCPGAELVSVVPGGTPEEALASSETIIQAHPDIAAIIGYNDSSALGAANAAEAAGLDPAKICVGGVDATPEAIAKIKEGGPFKFTVDNIPYENGRMLVDFMVQLLNGEELEFRQIIPTKIVDASNVQEY